MRFLCLVVALLALYSIHAAQEDTHQDGGLSPHAQEVLLAAARQRTIELESKDKEGSFRDSFNALNNHKETTISKYPNELPPLESLITTNRREAKIVQDVQFLLDFAVVGFGKCGTTTLLQWLQAEPSATSIDKSVSVRAPSFEAQYLVKEKPEQLVRKAWSFALEEKELKQNDPQARILKGFKNPSDIRRQKSRDLLTKYWPQTPLLVTVRHPVYWLVSIYNYFKIEKGRHQANLTSDLILDRGGRDVDGNTHHFVSTAKGEFHAMLAELGKTPLVANSAEWQLLQPWLVPSETARIFAHRLPNPIFLMEMGQLADTNTTRSQQFANDLEAFLGLPQGHLPPVLHVRPRSDLVKMKETDHLKMDICAAEFAPVLEEMVAIGRAASEWLQQYFIASEDVTVSSPEYLKHLLEEWNVNPCDNTL